MSKKAMPDYDGKQYSIWSNYLYACRWLAKWEGKRIFVLMGADVFFRVVQPLMQVALPGMVAAMLTSAYSPGRILFLIALYVVCLQVVSLAGQYLSETTRHNFFLFRITASIDYFRKCAEMDNQFLESGKGRQKISAAQRTVLAGSDTGVEPFLKGFQDLAVCGLGATIYLVVVGMESIPLLIFLCLATLADAWVKRIANEKSKRYADMADKIWEDFDYLKKVTIDHENGKDIRMYRMQKWFQRAFDEILDRCAYVSNKRKNPLLVAGFVSSLIMLCRDGVLYGYLILQMIYGDLPVSLFLLYIGIAASFDGRMKGIFSILQNLSWQGQSISRYRDFMESGVLDEDGKAPIENAGKMHELRLEKVCFRYEGEDRDAVHEISLTIRPGEKLALVGMNGAGKTTLVKLLCGLLHPTSGRIFLDGKDISGLSPQAYYREFAVVFQDVFALAFSLEENVTCDRIGQTDEKRLTESLKKAGLWERATGLPKGFHTSVSKDLDPEGVELSGGELQKLMLSRALYKNAPVVILDEPTASLDPIAESSMYEKYYEMTDKKTSVFISHRLSSTKFCDRILFMEDGKIVEEGTHRSLLELDGQYANMFRIQAGYYESGQGR